MEPVTLQGFSNKSVRINTYVIFMNRGMCKVKPAPNQSTPPLDRQVLRSPCLSRDVQVSSVNLPSPPHTPRYSLSPSLP